MSSLAIVMQSAFPTQQSELDYQLLQELLYEKLYKDDKRLYESDPDELIECCFRQYYVFLFNSYSLERLYKLFQQEAYRILAHRGQTNEETEYRLRSSRFVQFVQKLMTTIKNEPNQDPPSASTSGEDLNHVAA